MLWERVGRARSGEWENYMSNKHMHVRTLERQPALTFSAHLVLPVWLELKQTGQSDVIPRTLSFLSLSVSPLLYKHSCLRGMLAWENINHRH